MVGCKDFVDRLIAIRKFALRHTPSGLRDGSEQLKDDLMI
jgi:hypothetical protein